MKTSSGLDNECLNRDENRHLTNNYNTERNLLKFTFQPKSVKQTFLASQQVSATGSQQTNNANREIMSQCNPWYSPTHLVASSLLALHPSCSWRQQIHSFVPGNVPLLCEATWSWCLLEDHTSQMFHKAVALSSEVKFSPPRLFISKCNTILHPSNI